MPTAQQTRTIHALRRASGMTDADYRGLLAARFDVASSTALSLRAADEFIEVLRIAAPSQPRRKYNTATGKYAPILRALWIACYNLQLVDTRDDAALIAFCERQTGVKHTQFLTDAGQARSAIEALKAMATRAGVTWPLSHDAAADKRAVCEAVAKLAYQARAFTVDDASRLTGISRDLIFPDDLLNFAVKLGLAFHARHWSGADFDKLSTALGNRLRARRASLRGTKQPSGRGQPLKHEAPQ